MRHREDAAIQQAFVVRRVSLALLSKMKLLTLPFDERLPATCRFGDLMRVPGAALSQAIVAGLTFPVFFRLQLAGGPVLLSQIGYVAAAVGLIAATVFLGERYSAATWAGAGVIAIGIAITIWAQRRAVDAGPE